MQSVHRLFRHSSISSSISSIPSIGSILLKHLRHLTTMSLQRKFSNAVEKTRYFPNSYAISENQFIFDIEHSRKYLMENLKFAIENINKEISHDRPHIDCFDDGARELGGLYTGTPGVGYAFYHISRRSFLLAEEAQEYLSLAERHLKKPINIFRRRVQPCEPFFLLGDGGILVVCAALANRLGDKHTFNSLMKRLLAAGQICKKINFLKQGSDEMFVGRAGYLYGALWLNREVEKTAVPMELINDIANVIVQSGREYARAHNSPCPLMYAYYGTEYLGAAHGLCSILQVLMKIPGFLESDPDLEKEVRQCVDFYLTVETPTNNYPCALDELDSNGRVLRGEEDELVHWCHGAPGIVYLMAAAYLRWKDQRYLDACKRCADLVWIKGLLKKGPGLCHGVAGNGYVFLLLYRLTSDDTYLYRAYKFGEFMWSAEFRQNARIPDNRYSLYEGLAGSACFLADLMEPDKAAFPFQDVF